MPNTRPDCVTGSEFARYIQEEHNFRLRMEAQMDERHRDYMTELREIKSTVKDTNGRIGKAEANVGVIQRELEAIKSEDRSIEKTVQEIYKNGCHQFQNHVTMLSELEGAGVIPNQNGLIDRPAFRLPNLTGRQKAAASVGVAALLLPALGDLIRLITRLVDWVLVHAQ